MKNRELQLASTPTSEELYALVRAAQAARSAEMARLLRAAVSYVKNLFSAPEERNEGLGHA